MKDYKTDADITNSDATDVEAPGLFEELLDDVDSADDAGSAPEALDPQKILDPRTRLEMQTGAAALAKYNALKDTL